MSPRPAHQVAAAIIRRGDEIALVLQGAPGEEPFWGLPGGVVEHDELVPEGLAREVLEETGLEISLPARLGYIRQIDNRCPARLTGHRGTGEGYLVTVWLFDADFGAERSAPVTPTGSFRRLDSSRSARQSSSCGEPTGSSWPRTTSRVASRQGHSTSSAGTRADGPRACPGDAGRSSTNRARSGSGPRSRGCRGTPPP